MSTKHTPGPWTQVKMSGEAIRLIWGPEGRCVVDLTKQNVMHSEAEQNANARLIAAAPELLEACAEALEFADNYSDVVDGDDGQPKPNRAMRLAEMLRAAINKAEAK